MYNGTVIKKLFHLSHKHQHGMPINLMLKLKLRSLIESILDLYIINHLLFVLLLCPRCFACLSLSKKYTHTKIYNSFVFFSCIASLPTGLLCKHIFSTLVLLKSRILSSSMLILDCTTGFSTKSTCSS